MFFWRRSMAGSAWGPVVALGLFASVLTPLRAAENADRLPPELDVVPSTGTALFSVRLAEVWGSGAAADLRGKRADKSAESNLVAMMLPGLVRQQVGLKIEEIERLTIYSGMVERVLVVTARRPLDRDRLLRELLGTAEVEHRHYGKPLWVKKGGREGMVFWNDRTFLLSTSVALNAFLQDRENQKADGFLAPALRAAPRHQLVGLTDVPTNPGPLPTEPLRLDKMLPTRSLVLLADFKADANLRVQLSFADEAAARKAGTALQEMRKRAVQALPELRESLGDMIPAESTDGQAPRLEPPLTRDAFFRAIRFLETAEGALKKAEIRRTGKQVEVGLCLPSLRGASEGMLVLPMFLAPHLKAQSRSAGGRGEWRPSKEE